MRRSNRKKPQTQNIDHDLYDHEKFTKTFFKTDLKKTLTNGISDYKEFSELTQDIFYSLYKYSPKLKEIDEVKNNFQLNREFITKMMDTQEYKQLRAYSKMNHNTSAIGAATLSEQILKENKEVFEELKKQKKQMKQNQKQLKKLAMELKQIKKSPNPNKTQQKKALQNINQKIKTSMNKHKSIQQQQQQTSSQFSLYSALQKTTKSIKSQEEFFALGYGSGNGSFQKVSFQERLSFSKVFVNNDNFRKLLRMLGKLRRLAIKKQKTKTKRVIDTISDIIQSDHIQHLIPSEAIYLMDLDLQFLFDKKFVEKQLLTYDHSGQRTKSKGPIVACLDVSGSMEGERDEFSKGIALALVTIAHRENRNAVIIIFDYSVRKIFEFPKKDNNYWSKIVEMTEYFSGGGTNFNPPIKKAMEFFQEEKDYEKADFVMITDGDGALSEKIKADFLDLKKANKISTYTIIIDMQYSLVNHILSPISDQLIPVKELTNEVAEGIFEAI